MIKVLFFDVNAIIKYFIDEPGSNIVRWIVDNMSYQHIHIYTCKNAINEFSHAMNKKVRRGEIT